MQVPKVHGPLTQSLLFWQKQNRQGGASSARGAGRIELHGCQHPVEDATAPQAPRRWVHREYLQWVHWDNRVLILIFAPPGMTSFHQPRVSITAPLFLLKPEEMFPVQGHL